MLVTLPLHNWVCKTSWGLYENKNLALRLVDADDCSSVAVASVNGDWVARYPKIAIKTWSENSGMVSALVAADVIWPDVVAVHSSGFATVEVYWLTKAAAKEAASYLYDPR